MGTKVCNKERLRIKKELFLEGLKQCVRCGIIKNLSDFGVAIRNTDKRNSFCHKCDAENSKKYRENPIHRETYIESTRKQNKRYRENNKEKIREYSRIYQREWSREYRKRDYVREYRRNYHRKYNPNYVKVKMKTDLNFKLKCRLRDRIRIALKNCAGKKAYKTIELIGCDIVFLKQYLELLWWSGMSWDNYGFGDDKWNIDHIKPLKHFDLTDPMQQKEAFHYTNLQPLWQLDNLRKGFKYDDI